MILEFKIRQNKFEVTDISGEVRYVVKPVFGDKFGLTVLDELGVSELFTLNETDSGYKMYAFDTFLGELKKLDNGYSIEDNNITVTEENGTYKAAAAQSDADITISGADVAIRLQKENRAIIFIALAAAMYNEKQKEKKQNSVTALKKKHKLSYLKVFVMICDRLVTAIGKGIRYGGHKLTKTRKLNGKAATVSLMSAGLAFLISIGFFVSAIVLDNRNLNFVKTVATVDQRINEKVATYTVGGITYKIEDVPATYHPYQKFTVYYSLKKDGTVGVCRMEKYNTMGYYITAGVFFAISLVFVLITRCGVPKFIKGKRGTL